MSPRHALLGIALGAGLLAAAWSCRDYLAPEPQPSTRMADMMLSRVVPGEVAEFKDDTVMHGPLFYKFEGDAADVRRLVQLLDLRPVPRVPGYLAGRIEVAKSRTGWAFDWAHAQVQVAIHCEPALEDPFDVLLVDGRRVVYLTSGFAGGMSRAAPVVVDPGDCPHDPYAEAASALRVGAPMGTASGSSN
jgi:hypothetical protein